MTFSVSNSVAMSEIHFAAPSSTEISRSLQSSFSSTGFRNGFCHALPFSTTIGFYEERNAGNAVKALMDSLAPKAKVKRDGAWKEIESSGLVPGDMISFKIGDVVPADSRLSEAIYRSGCPYW